jgi:glycosyltransferase involved in cell wall biosynthesis
LVPSKFYGIAAAGSRPIIVIADKNGEIARLVQQRGCGIVVAPGDADVLLDALRLLTNASKTVAEMGKRARKMLEAHFYATKDAGPMERVAQSARFGGRAPIPATVARRS